MNEILLPGVLEKLYTYTLDNGLKIYMVPNNKTKNFYITLSTKYGSIYTNFEYNGKKYDMPKGIAHYLEHLLFNMPDGTTAHDYFSKLGANINAFTSFDITCYEVFANANFKECLSYLTEYVYTPYFTKEMVNNERGIITEEINMYEDKPGTQLMYGTYNNIFIKDERQYLVSGTVSDVKKITKEDLEICYEAFYHPENMFMIITGNFDPNEAVAIVSEVMSKKDFSKYNKPVLKFKKEPFEVKTKHFERCMNVNIPKVSVGFKVPKNAFKGLKIDERKVRLYFNLYMRVQFGITSYLRDELQSSKVITGGLSMNLLDTEDYYVEVITASTEYPDYFIKRVKETFDERDINEEDVIRKVNASVSNLIMYFDDIEGVNSQIQDDVIDFGEYMYNIYDVYKSLNIEDAREVVKRLNKHITTETIIKPLEEK